jgi:CubicO group peptidase (beta-lactamase class C family)
MHTTSFSTRSSSWIRPAAVLATTAALALALVGCGRNATTTGASGPPGTAGSGATTTTIVAGAGSTTTVASAPSGTGVTGGTGSPAAKPYTSAITDAVVANPAFGPMEKEITKRVTAAQLPGASLLVLQDGKLVEQNAVGTYDLSTKVPIASASKWLTGATIMTLVEDGLIDLDVPISTYLPDTTGPSAAITMRQLMSFTSGLEYDEKIPCYNDPTTTLAACNAEILKLPLLGKPGTGYRYTGTHLHVAAGVVEAVTHQTYEQVFQERIAQPLGMAQTTFVSALRAGASADGHPLPAGSGLSTLGDYGRFMEMLVHDGVAPDGTQILLPATIAEMGTNQIAHADFVSASPDRKANETPYGLAHWLDIVDADGHALLESSPGAFGFRPWFDHVNHIAGVYLIVDQDETHVPDSPYNTGATAPDDVQTSGRWIEVGAAKAFGGKLPGSKD